MRTARPQTEFLSTRIRALKPSGIRRFFDMLAEMTDVISLTIGEPDFNTPEPITQAAIDSLTAGQTHYTANGGIYVLREMIAADLARRYHLRYDPRSELIITVGASEALDATLRAICDPGDEVIFHEPAFVAYGPCITLAGGIPIPISTSDANDFRLTAAMIEPHITPRTKAIFLGYPNNPTGAVLEPKDLQGIAELAERHDLLLISDEIYERLVYGDHAHLPTASLPNMRERTVMIGGFSKSYAMTGWRIGWVAAPAALMTGIAKVHQYGIMCAPTSAQFAAIEALRSGEPFVIAMHDEYDRRRRYMTRRLNEMGLHCFEPRGAFYCFPDISATGLDDEEFARALLREERVAVVPGTAFGAAGAGHVRICYATAYEQIVEAMDRMQRFVERFEERFEERQR